MTDAGRMTVEAVGDDARHEAAHRDTTRPIALKSWQVRALLDGRLSRIVVPVLPSNSTVNGIPAARKYWTPLLFGESGAIHPLRMTPITGGDETYRVEPKWAAGDRLWVRETIAPRLDVDPSKDPEKARHYALYRADGTGLDEPHWHCYPDRWTAASAMPRWASRLTIEIESVQPVRLHDLTTTDISACGVSIEPERCTFAEECMADWWPGVGAYRDDLANAMGGKGWHECGCLSKDFAALWDTDHRKYPDRQWTANPWAWSAKVRRIS